MEDATLAHLDRAREESDFRIGAYFSEGFEIWKAAPGSFIGLTLLMIVFSIIGSIIPILGPVANGLLISPALTLGAYFLANRVDRDEEYRVNNFFDGFPFAGTLAVSQLVVFVCLIIIAAPFLVALVINVGNSVAFDTMEYDSLPAFDFNWWLFLFALPLIYASVLINYTVHFIGFFQLDFWEAVKYSALFVHKHWWKVFLFMVVLGIVSMVGLLGLIIGVFITVSLVWPISYASFKDLTQLELFQNGGIDEMNDSEIDLSIFR